MTRWLALVAVGLVVGGCVSASPAADRSDRIRQILASTVQLRSDREGGVHRAASGVVIATDPDARRAWIVTVGHFLTPSKPQKVYVELPGQEQRASATVRSVSTDDRDLAIIEVEDLDVTPVRFKDVATVGDEVLIVAFPWGRRFTVVRGIVSQVTSTLGEELVTGPARMVDASVSYGSSGGGVFDARSGELVGIVESYRTAKVGISGMQDRTLEVPVPGQTMVIPVPVILRFIVESGLRDRLPR
jgi:S1-C subfamily serine protease